MGIERFMPILDYLETELGDKFKDLKVVNNSLLVDYSSNNTRKRTIIAAESVDEFLFTVL